TGCLRGDSMRHTTRSFILLSALLSPATGSLAADRWVSRRGDDTGNACLVAGTPCKTVEHALAEAVSGDSINVAKGSYKVRLEVRTSTALAFLGGWDEALTTGTPELTPTILKARTYTAKDKRVIVAIAEAGETIALSIDGFVLSGGNPRTCGSVLVGVPALLPCQDGGGGLYVLAAGGDITVTV